MLTEIRDTLARGRHDHRNRGMSATRVAHVPLSMIMAQRAEHGFGRAIAEAAIGAGDVVVALGQSGPIPDRDPTSVP